MARLMVLYSLPRTTPGNRLRHVRRNGPYALVMSAGAVTKLPFGNLPRLLLAWLCTETVRTRSRELVLEASLSKFMRKLDLAPVGVTRARLRNQMDRFFCCRIELLYEESPPRRVRSGCWNQRSVLALPGL